MRRIAVTLDACQVSSRTLEEAVQLAVRMGAQLEGIFVEDIDLIQLAAERMKCDDRTIVHL